jgi:hypothetical protein
MADIGTPESSEVTVASSDGGNKLLVNADGSINVAGVTAVIDGGANETKANKVFGVGITVNLPTAGTETRAFLIRNPAGNTKNVIFWDFRAALSNTTVTAAFIRFYVNPTVTAVGTSVATHNRYRGSAVNSTALAYTGPTAATPGILTEVSYITGGSNGHSEHEDFHGSLILQPGQDLLVTGTPDGVNRALFISFVWSEENV